MINKIPDKLIKQTTKAVRLSKLTIDIGIAKTFRKNESKAIIDKYVGSITYNTLKNLGPTFVKVGQFISTRSDIFGKDFTDELKDLQDNVLPMSSQDIAHMKNEIIQNFEFINDTPIAAASIGQVHYGKLKNGKEVAVKFKRVNIEQTIKDDFNMLLSIIDFVKLFAINRQITEIEISLKQYYNLLKEEISFINEVQNMKTFRKQFGNIKWIRVPKPFESICTNDIIVMEYVPSIKINNTHEIEIMNFNKILISEKLLECFFTQIIQYGFVHIDPHPGNVGISKDGKIVFYDYGMFVKLDGVMKDKLKTLFLAMYDRDVDEVCNLLIELEIITVEPSKKAYFKKFIASFIIYIDNLNVDDFKLSYLDKIDQSEMQFLISSKFLLLLRGITILEGVCKNLNPNFNYRDILDPYISDFIIDINYIERRGEKDISRFTKAPDKITSSEISLGMIENDVDQLKKKLINFDLKTKYILSTILVVQELQVHSWESKIILASAFLYILLSR